MVLVHGGGPGAEKIAARWAESRGVHQVVCKPDWTAHGRAAPFRRNDQLLKSAAEGRHRVPRLGNLREPPRQGRAVGHSGHTAIAALSGATCPRAASPPRGLRPARFCLQRNSSRSVCATCPVWQSSEHLRRVQHLLQARNRRESQSPRLPTTTAIESETSTD